MDLQNTQPLTAVLLVELLKAEENIRAEELKDEFALVRMGELNYIVALYDDGNPQISFALNGYSVTADDLNVWNRTARQCRAYLDERHGAVLTADLLAAQGWSRRLVLDWLHTFDACVARFRRHVQAADLQRNIPRPVRAILN